MYGVLQKYQIDPIPWGGDVSSRIAANLGNSIFVAAYLIMVFPLTVMRIVKSFEELLNNQGNLPPNFLRASLYVFIATLQIIALYFSGSRGPWLGFGASLVFLWICLSLIWKIRWLTISGVILFLLASFFLIMLNLANGPLQNIRSTPGLYRLGSLVDVESRTGKVRTLIWSGAFELVSPHEPIEFPDGRKDKFNIFRPLIGYGPESMYVVYNPFYPPELTQVEKRNASPDRSHNETWDSLVITGILGLAVYLILFSSIIFYGLSWLGLIQSKIQRRLFFGLLISGGLISSVLFTRIMGPGLFGVALPFGMILGVLIYLILISLFGSYSPPESTAKKVRSYIILGLLAAIVAHFIEINFGIAIAATRLNFWVFTGLLFLTGFVFPVYELHGRATIIDQLSLLKISNQSLSDLDAGASGVEENLNNKGSEIRKHSKDLKIKNRKRQKNKILLRSTWSGRFFGMREDLIYGFILAILLITIGFNMLSNCIGIEYLLRDYLEFDYQGREGLFCQFLWCSDHGSCHLDCCCSNFFKRNSFIKQPR